MLLRVPATYCWHALDIGGVMHTHAPALRRTFFAALFAATILFASAGSAYALSTLSGTVQIWGSGGTALPGVRVEVFDADALWGDASVRTVLGTAITDVNGDYTVSNLPNDTLIVIAFEDLTGEYRDWVFNANGLPLELGDAYWTPVDDAMTDVNAWLLTLEDLSAARIARPAGSDRYGTSAAISKSYFGSADTVIIASGAGFADALAAAPLAGAYDAPILLTAPNSLPDVIGDEIERLGATDAYIIGGTNAVSDAVKSQLISRGITSITRLGGANRYATAEKVIYELPPTYFEGGALPFVCRGDSFADALSASPLATYYGMPILLTTPTKLPAETARAWKYMTDRGADTVFVVGSTVAVSDKVLEQLDASFSTGLFFLRFAGANRYATAAVVDDFFGPWDTLGLASGANFPDALSGGAAVGRWGGALVLTTPTSLHPSARGVIQANALYSIDLEAFGSTKAISAATFTSAINALGTKFYDIDNPAGMISLTGISSLSTFTKQANDMRPAGAPALGLGRRTLTRSDLRSFATERWTAK